MSSWIQHHEDNAKESLFIHIIIHTHARTHTGTMYGGRGNRPARPVRPNSLGSFDNDPLARPTTAYRGESIASTIAQGTYISISHDGGWNCAHLCVARSEVNRFEFQRQFRPGEASILPIPWHAHVIIPFVYGLCSIVGRAISSFHSCSLKAVVLVKCNLILWTWIWLVYI